MTKDEVLATVCDMLGVEDYEDLDKAVGRIAKAALTPPHCLVMVWNPEIPNSLSYRVMGVAATTDSIRDAAQVCIMVSTELTNKAIELAQQTTEDRGENGE